MKLPLSQTEKRCREYYLEHGTIDYEKLRNNDSLSDDNYTEAFHRLFLEAIHNFHEDMLIPPWTNMWVLSSPRYLPNYLHSHDFIELIYVYNGTCRHTVKNVTETLVEGDIFILPPNMQHSIECMDDDCIVFHIMIRCSAFDSSFLGMLKSHNALSEFFTRSLYGDGNASIKFTTRHDKQIKKLVWQIFKESQDHNDYTALMMETLFQILCLYLAKNHLLNLVIVEDGHDLSFIPEILEYISQHYKDVTIQDLAEHFNYSEGHLRRIISNATGKTFKNVVTDQKLIHARILLESSDLSVEDIAEQTGFGNVRTMQRLFKNKFGNTPSDYRQG